VAVLIIETELEPSFATYTLLPSGLTDIPSGIAPQGVVISPDGTRVYVANADSYSVSVINTATNTLIATIPVGALASPAFMAFSPDGSRIYVASQTSPFVSVINTVTNSVISTFTTNGSVPSGILISPDGSKAYVSVKTGMVLVINTLTNNIVTSVQVGTNSNIENDLAISPDGKLLYVSNNTDGTISVINTLTNVVASTIPCGGHPYAIKISNDGSKLYVANSHFGSSGSIAIINTASNTVENTINLSIDLYGIDLSRDNSLLYVESADGGSNMLVISTLSNTVVANIPGSNSYSFGHFILSSADCSGIPVAFTITVNPGPPTITATPATGTISACAGTASANPNIQQFTVSGSGLTGSITVAAPAGFEVSLASGSGYGSSLTLAQASGAVNSTVVYVRSAATASTGSISGKVTLTSAGASSQTVVVTGIVNPVVMPSLVIAASVNNICAGTPVTFTATPANGGSSPVYQWLLNGNNAGTNSPTFSGSTFANGDVVSCVMTSSFACVAPASATSNSITMNIIANVVPSITIAASQNTICAGTMVTFNATPINGGSTPVYQWLVNGNNAGTNSGTFSGSNLADGDIVSCEMTSNAGCVTPASATSNSINMSVSPLISPAIRIVVSQNNICPGTNVTFTATPTNGGSSPVYQWLLNGNNIGVNSPTFASSTLSNGDVISCRVTSNATCLTISDAASNNITMTVNAQAAPAVSINISANNVCAGTPVTFTASPTNGGSSPVYQWLLNGNNAGANSPTFSSSTFANGDMVMCMMTSSLACAAPLNIASNSIITNISPLPVVNGGGNKTIEKGSSVALTATGSENITDITWTPLTGLDNNKILIPQASPASTTSYTITVQTAAGCMAIDYVTVTVLEGISIPNTFTPNGDGVNDKWDIQDLKDYQNCVVRIFDRYGAEVYNSKGYYNAWDGTIKGQRLPVGTYYYLINLNDGTRPISGFVALIR